MIALILISAGIGYFVSLPFASLLQGANYRLTTYFQRGKRWLFLCAAVACVFSAGAFLIGICGKLARVALLTVTYALMGGFALFLHKRMGLKLTVTNRLVRLLVLNVLLYIALFLPLFWMGQSVFWTAFPALSPFVLCLSCLLISPFEKKNNERYLSKAKQVLKETPAIKIGITGSYGKTGVKNALEQLVSARYETLTTPANYNTPLGIAKTLTMRSGREEIMILEMGARRRGDICELCDLVQPTIGIITGIAPQHLETFGSLQVILSEKGVLASTVPKENPVYYNLTDEKVRMLYEARTGKRVGIGFENADYLIREIKNDGDGTSFLLQKGEESIPIRIPLYGQAAVVNVALSCAVAIDLGVTTEEIRERASLIRASKHRFEVVKQGGITIIDDSYNVNPIGAEAALKSLEGFVGKRKIVYCSGMVELGRESEELNRALGEHVASVADLAIIGGGRYGDLVEQGVRRADPAAAVVRVKDTAEASATFRQLLKEGDVLLIMSDLPRDYLL